MADALKVTRPDSPVSPVRSTEGKPESPTTAHELDLDDEQEASAVTPTKTSAPTGILKPAPPPKDEAPPVKPPRPVNPREQAEKTLKEAFPTIDMGVIKAVLTASGGQVEPAFNALLEMTDPDAVQEEQLPPPMPPRPVKQPTTTNQSQLEADEMYARQLAEHYNGNPMPQSPVQRQQRDRYNQNLPPSRPGRPGANPNPDDYHWRSFIDDDLPEIRDNIKKGFFETQKTVNSWLTTFKKRLDGEDEEDMDPTTANTVANRQTQQVPPTQPRRSNEYQPRRSADYNRYDADPQVIGDDFSKLNLRDGDHPPRTTSRPTANPNLFRSAADGDRRKSSPMSGRKVSFQAGPPEEIKDMYSSPTQGRNTTAQTTGPAAGTAGKSSKWQPLSTVTPSPVNDNDPFSLGDSDDEKDAKPITMKDDDFSTTKTAAKVDDDIETEKGKAKELREKAAVATEEDK